MSGASARSRWARLAGNGYVGAAAAVAAATALAWLVAPVLQPPNLVMIYLLAVVLVALRGGRGPAVAAAVLSVAAFDFFFVPPRFTLAVAHTQSLVTFAVMLLVALVIGGLVARVRHQVERARRRERWTAALSAMSRELGAPAPAAALATIAARHVREVFDAEVAVLLTGPDGRLDPSPAVSDLAGGVQADLAEHAVARGEPVGRGTPRTPTASALYLPLAGPTGPRGVLVVRPRRREVLATPEAVRQLETFAAQVALALEHARLAAEAQEARVRAETERLRSALLTSVSHDLRTPLATITGAATTLLDSGARLDAATCRELLESIRDEAERLNRLVQNLLQMTRLEAGALELRRDWHPLEEVVGAALARLARSLGTRRVTVRIPPDLPLVAIDDVLIEQVLVNLLDNAVKHTPPESPIRILATAAAGRVTVEVADHGPGLPPGEEERVFEKFYRAGPARRPGAGLGLAICRGIVEAHGGRIWAQNLPEGGVAFLFTVPAAPTPTPPLAVDA